MSVFYFLEEELESKQNATLTECAMSLPGKHVLPMTPTRHEREPSVERAKSTETRLEDGQEVKARVKLSGKFVRQRHENFDNILKDNREEYSGEKISQKDVFQLLSLTDNKENKKMTTLAMQRVFPMATLNKRQGAYEGLRKVVSFSKDEEGVL